MDSIYFVFIHLYSYTAPHCNALSRRITDMTTFLIYRSPIRLNSLIHFNWMKKLLLNLNSCFAVNTNSHSLLLMVLFFMDEVLGSQGAVVTS